MIAHIFGIPVEETAAQLVPVAAAIVTAVAVARRTYLDQLRRPRLPRSRDEGRPPPRP